MALVRVIAHLLCPSQADAGQVRDAISQKLATKPLITINSPATANLVTPTVWGVTLDVAFTLQVDAVDVRDDIKAKWTSGGLRNKILAGSTVTLHLCAHNDGESGPYQSCRERQFELSAK